MKLPIDYSKIAEGEKTAVVSALLEIVEQQSVTIQQLIEQIQHLKDEIARLKGQKPKPNIRPSKLEKDCKEKKSSSGKRPGSQKREKTANLIINNEIRVPPESIPSGSIFKGYQPYTVQGIKIFLCNFICF